jgi:hypothetical protein
VRAALRAVSWMPVVLLVLACGEAAATDNAVLNPAFKTGLGYWEKLESGGYSDNWTGSVGATAPGAYAVTTNGQINSVVLRQCRNVFPATTYSFGTYYRISSVLPARPIGHIGITWLTGQDCSSSTIRSDDAGGNITPDIWQAIGALVTSPVNAKSALLDLGVSNDSANAGTVYFDDVFLVGVGVVKGDASGDGAVDVSDVFYLINFLFAGGPAPL